MTKSRALIRARLELGQEAWVRHYPKAENPEDRFQIGIFLSLQGARFRECKATGETWDRAFENLDRKRRGVSIRLLPEEAQVLLDAHALPARFHNRLVDMVAEKRAKYGEP